MLSLAPPKLLVLWPNILVGRMEISYLRDDGTNNFILSLWSFTLGLLVYDLVVFVLLELGGSDFFFIFIFIFSSLGIDCVVLDLDGSDL